MGEVPLYGRLGSLVRESSLCEKERSHEACARVAKRKIASGGSVVRGQQLTRTTLQLWFRSTGSMAQASESPARAVPLLPMLQVTDTQCVGQHVLLDVQGAVLAVAVQQ